MEQPELVMKFSTVLEAALRYSISVSACAFLF